jgi:DNA-binding transcriptional LysR family regulator
MEPYHIILALMTLRQLRFLQEIARNAFNISAAAAAMHTAQPGVSRQIALLEEELGVTLLARRKNKILGLTDTGHEVLAMAERLLTEAENIRLIAAEVRGEAGGRLVVATSHLHARYTLRDPAKAFSKTHPDVELHLVQADPANIAKLVESGSADIGVSTELPGSTPGLLLLRSRAIKRSAIMPIGHPLGRKRRLTLADLARYPLVGYHAGSTAGSLVSETLRGNGLTPRLVVSANDSDVIKTYVAEGLGIAVVPALALTEEDRGTLLSVDVTALFPKTFMTLSLSGHRHLRRYLTDFIELVAPEWKRSVIQRALTATRAAE